MQSLIVILLAVVAGAIIFVGLQMRRPEPEPIVQPVTPVQAPTVDMAAIIAAVKESIDVKAISTGVQGAVETKIHEAATKVLQDANDNARKLAEERLEAQTASIEQQTKNLMQPFELQMETLKKEVEKLHVHNSEKFGNVDEAVKGLALQTQALRSVLSSAQGRGNWGERMLEDILAQAGFERGINYEKQEILVEGGRPDYSFFLPENRVLYLDSKFPADNYVKYHEAADENSRNMYRASFLKNVEDRVKELEKRDYVAQSTRSALDYVLLFIPNESVLGFIQQHKPSLIDDAVKKRVVLCSPLTLYAFLGVVRQATDSFHMEQNANEVLSLLASFTKAWTAYKGYLVNISKGFALMQNRLKAVTTGKVAGELSKPLQKVDEIVKARSIAVSDETLKEMEKAFEQIEPGQDAPEDD